MGEFTISLHAFGLSTYLISPPAVSTDEVLHQENSTSRQSASFVTRLLSFVVFSGL